MTVIEAINDTAKALTNLSKALTTAEAQQKEVSVVEDKVTTKPKEAEINASDVSTEANKAPVTIEQIRAVMAEKSQAGLTAQVKELLETFGAAKLSAVNPEDYEALLEAAKEIK